MSPLNTHTNDCTIESLTQYNKNVASSNLQENSDDLTWEEESNSQDHNLDEMIVEVEDEEYLYARVKKETTGKKEKKKVYKKTSSSKHNKPQTRLDSKKPLKIILQIFKKRFTLQSIKNFLNKSNINLQQNYTGDENLPYICHMGDHLCHMVTFYLPYIVIW